MSRKTIQTKTQTANPAIVFGICIFLAAIIWVVFSQTLHHEFINLDDADYVVRNAQVNRGLTLDGIVWAFTSVHSANWHPITWISHMLDCQFYGLSPGGHHFTNVALHITTAILLFLILLDMTNALWRSAFVAAVFAIHPLRVESVAWVAERKDVLSGLFFALTIGAYVRYARHPWSPVRYGLVLILFALGLMCKPMLVTLPFVLLLLDYWPLNRVPSVRDSSEHFPIPRRLIREKLPLLGLSAASCVITLFSQTAAIRPLTRISFPERVGNALISCATYLRQMFWPTDLAVFYPFSTEGVGISAILSLFLLAGITAAVLVLRRRRYLLTGWLWYIIMLAPVIGIVQVGDQARADRYTYLPQIGLCLILVWGTCDLCTGVRHRRLMLSALSGIILFALIRSARTQTSFWQNSESLWAHTLACTSDNNAMAHKYLGHALYEKDPTKAIAHYQKALQLDPNDPIVHSNLGVAFLQMGRVDESIGHLQKALEINPKYADAHYNLGNSLLRVGRAEEALAHYRKVFEIDPNNVEARNNMAWVLATWPETRIRDGQKAVELAERADALTDRVNPVISKTLAAAYAEAGRFPDALKTAERALKLTTDQGDTALANSIRAQIELYQSGSPFRAR